MFKVYRKKPMVTNLSVLLIFAIILSPTWFGISEWYVYALIAVLLYFAFPKRTNLDVREIGIYDESGNKLIDRNEILSCKYYGQRYFFGPKTPKLIIKLMNGRQFVLVSNVFSFSEELEFFVNKLKSLNYMPDDPNPVVTWSADKQTIDPYIRKMSVLIPTIMVITFIVMFFIYFISRF